MRSAATPAVCRMQAVICVALAAWCLAEGFTRSAGAEAAAGADGFAAARPLLTRYCLDCHSG
ncbi:MAG: hypothetical protein ACKOWG_06350, partial [Planctomycetia bacterium]